MTSGRAQPVPCGVEGAGGDRQGEVVGADVAGVRGEAQAGPADMDLRLVGGRADAEAERTVGISDLGDLAGGQGDGVDPHAPIS
jgi:hypothetical protein